MARQTSAQRTERALDPGTVDGCQRTIAQGCANGIEDFLRMRGLCEQGGDAARLRQNARFGYSVARRVEHEPGAGQGRFVVQIVGELCATHGLHEHVGDD